jgi:hypothetical protein
VQPLLSLGKLVGLSGDRVLRLLGSGPCSCSRQAMSSPASVRVGRRCALVAVLLAGARPIC